MMAAIVFGKPPSMRAWRAGAKRKVWAAMIEEIENPNDSASATGNKKAAQWRLLQ
jgi:hypothetical protein